MSENQGNASAPSDAQPQGAESNHPAPATAPTAEGTATAAPIPDDDEGKEVHRIPGDLYRQLVGMGFSENGVKKSFVCGCINEETCLQWLTMHAGMPELDTDLDPNIKIIIVEKKHYTPEELAQKVEEMKRKVAENKAKAAKDEAERERVRELQRIANAKAMREAAEEREKKQRMEAYEEMRKQKMLDAQAKEKVQLQIAIDKKVRQGMDPDAARAEALKEFEAKKAQLEEEKKRLALEREKERQEEEERRKAESQKGGGSGAGTWDLSKLILDADAPDPATSTATTASRSGAPSATVAGRGPASDPDLSTIIATPTVDQFQYLIAQLLGKCSDANLAFQSLTTMKTICANIAKSPLDMKYRTLKRTTTVFQTKIAPVPHALEFLFTLGFRSEKGEDGVDCICLRSLLLYRIHNALAALTAASVN